MSAAYINQLADEVESYTNCQAIQLFVDEHVKSITDLIESQVTSISEIAATWAPLLSLPTDPMKILKWASKVVGGPIAAQIALMAQIAAEMALTAAALARLVGAISNAIEKLTQCLTDAVLGAINDIQNELLEGAGELISQAEAIKDQLVSDLLVSTGAQDVIDATAGVTQDISSIGGSIDSIENSVSGLPSI